MRNRADPAYVRAVDDIGDVLLPQNVEVERGQPRQVPQVVRTGPVDLLDERTAGPAIRQAAENPRDFVAHAVILARRNDAIAIAPLEIDPDPTLREPWQGKGLHPRPERAVPHRRMPQHGIGLRFARER